MELTYELKEELGLLWVQDRMEPACPYGAKRLREEGWYAPERREELERELDNVSLLRFALEEDEDRVLALRHALSTLKDITRTLDRCESGTLTEVELFELTAFSLGVRALLPLAQALPCYEKLSGIRFAPVDGPLGVLDPAGSGRLSFYVEDGRSPALARARREKRELDVLLRRGGVDREALMARRLSAAAAEEAALGDIYREMSAALRPHLPALRTAAAAAGRLDAVICKAILARSGHAVRPQLGGDRVSFRDAVHPQIAGALRERGRDFAPISAELPRGVTVLTGANMGGKSVAMKTVALNIALALTGYFVFCREGTVPLFDRMELINRDFSDSLGGLSSFGGEIVRFNASVERLEEGGLSFIAMDELARGTNAQEGAAIARGVVRYLSDKNAVTLLATHYDGAAAEAARHYQVRGLRSLSCDLPRPSSARDGLRMIEDAMDYGLERVEKDAPCRRDALRICAMLGMKPEILEQITEEKESTE